MTMLRRKFAVCYTSTDPLSCRTGFTIMKTHNTLRQARAHYARTKGPGFYIAERQGDTYVRYTAPLED